MSELIETGFEITLIGMGAVFVLLVLLVFVMQAMSRFAHFVAGPPSEVAAARGDDAGLTAAITAAVHAYRRRHGRGRGS